jgi:hypothetical protein
MKRLASGFREVGGDENDEPQTPGHGRKCGVEALGTIDEASGGEESAEVVSRRGEARSKSRCCRTSNKTLRTF